MASLGRKHERAGATETALVVAADAPPEHAPKVGNGSHGGLRLLVNQQVLSVSFRFSADRWLVPGEDVGVTLDPAKPGEAEVDWDSVAPMQDRAAANIPPLVDPIGARRKVAALQGLPDDDARKADGFEETLKAAAQAQAPSGKRRAVVLVSTIRGFYWLSDPDTGAARHGVTRERNSAAVLSVNVPGEAPYAVFEKKFKFPRGKGDIAGTGLPAVVSESDPQKVEVLWGELASSLDQVSQRMSDQLERAMQPTELEQQMNAAIGQATADAQTPLGAGEAANLGAMAPDMRQFAADNAKRTLQFIQDPAQRSAMIAQYKAMGIDVGEDA